MSDQAKAAGVVAAAFAAGLAAGWLLNTYAKTSIEEALAKLQEKLKRAKAA
jgi:uncharacterized membrane protein YciS (DUF1049 family)